MAERFIIRKNYFLKKDTIGYYNRYYTGFNQPGNPNFLNILKNTFNDTALSTLNQTKREVENILLDDIPDIIRDNKLSNCVCVCIPRAKALDTYTPNQLFFRDAISDAVSKMPGVIDGSNFIVRHTNTRTTHLPETTGRVATTGRVSENDGKLPYPGITIETCTINSSQIRNRNIILIDDIYTNGVNIDEDCIQALLNTGAQNVIFYAIAYTRRYS
jgi:phosphoribosylpyrophosphate synthetase